MTILLVATQATDLVIFFFSNLVREPQKNPAVIIFKFRVFASKEISEAGEFRMNKRLLDFRV